MRDDEGASMVGTLTEQVGSLRLLVDQFPAVFWTTDRELRFTSSLGAGLATLGLGPNQLVGMTLPEFFEADQSQPLEAHRRALQGRSVTYLMRWGGRTFHAHVAPLRDAQGRTIGTICLAMDLKGSGGDGPVQWAPGLESGNHSEEWRFIEPG